MIGSTLAEGSIDQRHLTPLAHGDGTMDRQRGVDIITLPFDFRTELYTAGDGPAVLSYVEGEERELAPGEFVDLPINMPQQPIIWIDASGRPLAAWATQDDGTEQRSAVSLIDAPDNNLTAAVLLLRWDALTAMVRTPLLRHARQIHVCAWRPRRIADTTTGPRWSFCWATWRCGCSGPPTLYWIEKSPSKRAAAARI